MRVVSLSPENQSAERASVVGIGVFDGVHLGHQKLLEEVVRRAALQRMQATILTFSPHPRNFFQKAAVNLLESLEKRLERFASHGIELTAVASFTESFAQQSAALFCRNILKGILNAHDVIVGSNFRFGRDHEGTVARLHQQGVQNNFGVHALPMNLHDGSSVSSTRIRALLAEGEVQEANHLLGRPHAFRARVIAKLGSERRLLGFPLAQVTPCTFLHLRDGVYATRAHIPGIGQFDALFAAIPSNASAAAIASSCLIHLFGYHGEGFAGSPLELHAVGRLHDWVDAPDPMTWRTLLSADQARTRALTQRWSFTTPCLQSFKTN